MLVEKRRLRSVMPYCDGKANPMLWFVHDGDIYCGGPFDTQREAFDFADREIKDRAAEAALQR